MFLERYLYLIAALTIAPVNTVNAADIVLFGVNLPLADFKEESSIGVSICDDVSDRCWLNANSSKSAVEIALSRSGYRNLVGEDSPSEFKVIINAFGYGIQGGCAVVVSTAIAKFDSTHRYSDFNDGLISFSYQEIASSRSILTGSREDISTRIRDVHQSQIEEIIVGSIRERNKTVEKIVNSDYGDSESNSYWKIKYQK